MTAVGKPNIAQELNDHIMNDPNINPNFKIGFQLGAIFFNPKLSEVPDTEDEDE